MPDADGINAQILLILGELKSDVAVLTEQLKNIPDMQARLRLVETRQPERLDERLRLVEQAQAASSAGRDWWARAVAGVAVLAAVAGVVAAWIRH